MAPPAAASAPARPSAASSVAPTTRPAAPVAARASVSATPTVPVARVGARVHARGTVTGAATGTRVALQQLHGRTWRTVGSATVSRGRYTATVPTGSAGMFAYRVATVPKAGTSATTSRPFSLAVGRGNPAALGYLTAPPARWNPCAPIRYRVNLAGAPAGAAADIDRSIRQVSAASGLRFVKAGTTRAVPGSQGRDVLDTYPRDTQLVIAFVSPGTGKGRSAYLPRRSDTVGVGGAFYTNATTRVGGSSWHQIVQGYLVLDRTKKLPGGFGSGNRSGLIGTWGQVMMHELGHVVGLDHPRPSDPAQIMYPATTTKPAIWGAGDLVALRRIGASSGCLRTPGLEAAAATAPTVGAAGAAGPARAPGQAGAATARAMGDDELGRVDRDAVQALERRH